MKFYRVWALIERDMRKYFRSPALMMTTMVLPLMQLIVLGYAFGGKIKNAPVAVVDEAPKPPRELLATVLDLTAARRRRRRWLEAGLGVAAALVIAAGVFGGLRIGSTPAQQPSSAQSGLYVGPPNGPMQTVTGKSGDMTATVSYSAMGWGTQLDTKVTGIPVGTNCQLWVIDSSGNRYLAGNWDTDNLEGNVWYPGSVGLPAKDVAGFQVTVGHGQPIQVTA